MATVLVPLSSRKYPDMVAVIDEADADFVLPHRWYVRRDGENWYVYRQDRHGEKPEYLHRVLMGAGPHEFVDHHNRNGLDNRRENLRLCTVADNNRNHPGMTRPGRTSKFKGVCQQKGRRRWRAMICFEGHDIFIGSFATEQEAAHAYDQKAAELFGEFACLNFVDDLRPAPEDVLP